MYLLGLEYYQVCPNGDLWLILDFFCGKVKFALVIAEDYDMKAILYPLTKNVKTVPATYSRHAHIW